MKEEQLEQLTNSLIALLEKTSRNIIDEVEDPFITLGFNAKNLVSNKCYTGFNSVRLAVEAMDKGYKSSVWGTYKQWQENGCQVRKGEKSTMVIWCKPIKYENEVVDDSGETKIVENTVNVAKVYFVFNGDQVDGYKEEFRVLEGMPKEECLKFFKNCGIKQEEYRGKAFYRPSEDTVYVPPYSDFIGEAEYVATVAHEYCHATGAKHRLDRNLKNKFGDDGYAFEELIAEIGAGMVAGYLGYTYQFGKSNIAYLKSWLEVLKNDRSAVIRACSYAQKAFDYLVNCQEGKDDEA